MIRTLIVDDQNIIRQGIKVLLNDSTEIELVGFAEDGETTLTKIEATSPDVVLLDINLPGIDGLAVAEQIAAKFPQIKVIMLSSCEDESYVNQAIASSAKGYLLKNISAEELEWSIKLVHQGYSAFKSELLPSFKLPKRQTVSKQLSLVQEPKVVLEQKNQPVSSASVSSVPKQQANSEEFELLLARNHFRQKYSSLKHQRRNFAFHDVNISRTKKTMMSFEFRLLVLIILFSLGFLVFVALS